MACFIDEAETRAQGDLYTNARSVMGHLVQRPVGPFRCLCVLSCHHMSDSKPSSEAKPQRIERAQANGTAERLDTLIASIADAKTYPLAIQA